MNVLAGFPLWAQAVLVLGVLLAAIEAGFWLGERRRRTEKDPDKVVTRDLAVSGMLALLGLVIAFTYSFSMSRSDLRKQAVIAEANALSTAFLRADTAQEPARSALKEALYRYALTRVFVHADIESHEKARSAVVRSLQAQARIWPVTQEVLASTAPDVFKVSIMHSINDVLDAHTKRWAFGFDQLPFLVRAMVLTIAASSLALVAYNAALGGTLYRFRLYLFAVIIGTVLMIIVDFDEPLRGLIQTNEASLVMVIREMEASLGVIKETP